MKKSFVIFFLSFFKKEEFCFTNLKMNIIPKLTIKPSPFDEKDWVVSSIYSQIDLPEKIDYRSNINAPRNQKEQGWVGIFLVVKEWSNDETSSKIKKNHKTRFSLLLLSPYI